MRRVAVVQARMGSTRLPGKALLDVAGRPMLGRVIDRLGRCRQLDAVCVATTDTGEEAPIVAWCRDEGVAVHRGSEEDVLARFVHAARAQEADVVVRITSDCPLIDPGIVDAVVEALGQADYASNTLPPRTYPRGLDVEAFTRAALERAHTDEQDPALREHVTPHLYRNPAAFALVGVAHDVDASGHRWTVDTPEDLALARRIYAHFGHGAFDWRECLAACRAHPEWEAMNAHVRQKVDP